MTRAIRWLRRSRFLGRGAALAAVTALTGTAVWLTWPRAGLTIRVDAGGSAVVLPKYGARWRRAIPLPTRLEVGRGELVRVLNLDTAWARLGLFSSPPRSEGVARAPTRSGRFTSFCSAHPGREISILIR